MRKLLNTLYVTSDDMFLSVANENAVIWQENQIRGKFPLHTLESIVTFSRKGASVPLIAECVQRGIPIFYMTHQGSLLAKVGMSSAGSIDLRRLQFRLTDQEQTALPMIKTILRGKLRNAMHTIDRARWDLGATPRATRLSRCSEQLSRIRNMIEDSSSRDLLRGWEGEAANVYFSVFNDLISDPSPFVFHGRSYRPPLDEVNALLSFTYTLLTNECTAALESTGLDASLGFMHMDHTGRYSLACDLVEELRSSVADRFVLSLINNRVLNMEHFDRKERNAVYLNRGGRNAFLAQWQKYKAESVYHPFFQEKIPLGLIPFAQAILLAKAIRNEIREYIPFFRR